MGCGTNSKLIALIADGKVSEPEVNWIKANLLSESELAQLVTIEDTKQGNLFAEDNEEQIFFFPSRNLILKLINRRNRRL